MKDYNYIVVEYCQRGGENPLTIHKVDADSDLDALNKACKTEWKSLKVAYEECNHHGYWVHVINA